MQQNKRAFSDDFTFEVNEKVVSIVAKETGFQGIQPQALEAFTSLLDSCKCFCFLIMSSY